MSLKRHVKKLLGSNWPILVRMKGSRPVRILCALPGYPIRRLNYERNHPFFAISITGKMGMGAIIIQVLKLLRHADTNGLIPIIRANNSLYAEHPQENMLEKYFELSTPLPAISGKLRFVEVEYEEHYMGLNVQKEMSLEEARSIFNRYLKFSDDIRVIVDRYIAANGGDFALAIHYRGTDKSLEAPIVPFECVFRVCHKILEECSTMTVFLATDSSEFAQAIKAAFPRIKFFSFDFTIPLNPETPRHLSTLKPSENAIEALVNIVFLSKCRFLVRTSSYLSAVSCIMNREIKVVTLGNLDKPKLFPERQIHEAAYRLYAN